MKAANSLWVFATVLVLLIASNDAVAQRLSKNLPFRQSRDRSATNEFQLTESAGPWLIMCASFGGENGMADAKRLAQELRDAKLKTYIFSHSFRRPDVVEGIGWELYTDNMGNKRHRPKTMKHANDQSNEIAVLVGDFASVDDARAQRLLEQIKRYTPKALDTEAESESQVLKDWREFARRNNQTGENRDKGPMRAAFLLPNPLFPDEYFAEHRVDHFVLKMNKKVRYSLLDNPHNFTVRVATFRGDATFDLNEIDQKEKELNLLKRMGKPLKESKLAEAFDKANRLTKKLRELGVDAYEFHDRAESYVCVGGFDWVSKGSGANQVFNPEVARVIEKFKGTPTDLPNMKGVVQPKQLREFKKTNIVFDINPKAVPVPKQPVGSFGRRR